MDPRAAAVKKFIEQEPPGGLDVILRYGTDPPMAIDTIVKAVREGLEGDDSCVIELGPGSGWLLQELLLRLPRARLHALDLAPAFIDTVRRAVGGRVQIVHADMETLPFQRASFDVVTTNWTLYFMRHLDSTLRGIRHCLKPGGRLVAATVAPDHMKEFDALVGDCVRAVTGRDPEPDSATPFNTATGMIPMQRAFVRVELREWKGELALPDVNSALALLPNWGPQDLSSDERAMLITEFAGRVAAILRREPCWRITRHDGAFVAIA